MDAKHNGAIITSFNYAAGIKLLCAPMQEQQNATFTIQKRAIGTIEPIGPIRPLGVGPQWCFVCFILNKNNDMAQDQHQPIVRQFKVD